MSFGADEEILQDFLVEAGEILEQLSEQLVELESRPDDADLLNAIFRGFHTVKGGAGFLQLNELVECCHIAENVFDILRKGERRVDAELMDVVLEALDSVNSMFGQVRERTEVTPASRELLAALEGRGHAAMTPIEVGGADLTGSDGLVLIGRTLLVVRQNLLWAAVYNLVAVPLALAGWMPRATYCRSMAPARHCSPSLRPW